MWVGKLRTDYLSGALPWVGMELTRKFLVTAISKIEEFGVKNDGCLLGIACDRRLFKCEVEICFIFIQTLVFPFGC